jgi:hypothetical protein
MSRPCEIEGEDVQGLAHTSNLDQAPLDAEHAS